MMSFVMDIVIHDSIRNKEPGFLVGYAIINGVSVCKSQNPLKKQLMEVITDIKNKYSSREQIYLATAIRGMRDLFKRNGLDPSRYAPSAEALLKRIVDGKDLYRINNVVECNNLGSMKFELPMGVYNLDNLRGDITFQFGTELDVMDTMAKGQMNMKDIMLTRDAEKLFGSPVSDSPHAIITDTVKNVLLLVYGPLEVDGDYVLNATEYTAKKIIEHAGGTISRLEVITSK